MTIAVHVNYWAILVCGLVSIGLGYLWYNTRIFGRIWMDSVDHSEEEARKNFKPLKSHGLSFIGHLIMACALAQVMALANANTVTEGIRFAFLCWIGFTATAMLINNVFEGESMKRLLVDGGYHLITLLVFGIILGAWSI